MKRFIQARVNIGSNYDWSHYGSSERLLKEVFNRNPECEIFESKNKHPTINGIPEPITKKEVEEGLKALKTKSAAGVDGVTCADLIKAKDGKTI